MRCDRRLGWLLAAHLVLGLLSAVLATVKVRTPIGLQHILIVPLFALTPAQVSLLGLWAIFAPSASWKRFTGLVIGTAYLEAAFDLASEQEFLFMTSATSALTVASLLVVRWSGVRLIRRADGVDPRRPESQGFQFSIRGLMVLTAVVALLSAVARAVPESPGPFRFAVSVIWSVCFVAVNLLSFRAVSGHDHPLRRGLLAVVVSPILGAFFALAVHAHRDGWVYALTIMLLYPAVLLGSLLVVRACGFRLVGRRAWTTEGGGEATLGNDPWDGKVPTAGETPGCETGTG